MAGGCQTVGQGPNLDRRATHRKKGIVGLGDMQEAHRHLNFGRSCSARLQAGTVDSSTCPPEGGRYISQNRVLAETLEPGKSLKKLSSCRELYSPELSSHV